MAQSHPNAIAQVAMGMIKYGRQRRRPWGDLLLAFSHSNPPRARSNSIEGAQMLCQLLQCQRVVLIVTLFFHHLVDVAANQWLTSFGLRSGSGWLLRLVFTFIGGGEGEHLLMYQFVHDV